METYSNSTVQIIIQVQDPETLEFIELDTLTNFHAQIVNKKSRVILKKFFKGIKKDEYDEIIKLDDTNYCVFVELPEGAWVIQYDFKEEISIAPTGFGKYKIECDIIATKPIEININ